MKNKDEKLLAEAYQTILENFAQQPTGQQSVTQISNPKTQNAINALTQMSKDLQNPRLPNKENLITSIGNALQTLSRESGPYQQQAGQILKWLGQSQASMRGSQGMVARGFVASKLPEEINKLLSSGSQQPVKEALIKESGSPGEVGQQIAALVKNKLQNMQFDDKEKRLPLIEQAIHTGLAETLEHISNFPNNTNYVTENLQRASNLNDINPLYILTVGKREGYLITVNVWKALELLTIHNLSPSRAVDLTKIDILKDIKVIKDNETGPADVVQYNNINKTFIKI
jgi:hypothetical protein